MSTEIEAKLKVDSIDQVAAKLEALGGEFQRNVRQRDYYFDDAENSLTKSDSCLRLRREMTCETEKTILTFKGPKEKTRLKKRREVEFQLDDFETALELLGALGFSKQLVLEKSRGLWRFRECEIALDELPMLGKFVEIEGPDEQKIASVQAKLKLAHLPHIKESYAALMTNKLQEQKSG